mgnify:CR=1 FL=1
MSNSIENTLVLCDLDNLLLNAEGNLPQLHRDVLQLFASRGGKLTVYSQRSPKVVRSVHLRWFAAAFWPIILRRAAAQRCAALPGWKIPS